MHFRQLPAWSAIVLSLASLAACATPAVAPASSPGATATATVISQPAKPGGKLTPRLQMLASTPALRAAPAAVLARALSLPEQGPGSLVLDANGRVLVTIRASDVSTRTQETLQHLGVHITSVSDRYQQVSAFVSMDALNTIADLPAVLSVQEELAPGFGDGPAGGAVPQPKPSAYP